MANQTTPRYLSDGNISPWLATGVTGSTSLEPRVYFVNGIRVHAEAAVDDARFLSAIARRPVFGVYNATGRQGARRVLEKMQGLIARGADAIAGFLQGPIEAVEAAGRSLTDALTSSSNWDWVQSVGHALQEAGSGAHNAGAALIARARAVVNDPRWGNIDEAGSVLDFVQCVQDWSFAVGSKLSGYANARANAGANQASQFVAEVFTRFGGRRSAPMTIDLAARIRARIPEANRVQFLAAYLRGFNPASAALFLELVSRRGSEKTIIVAHSQGNLVTADALWAITIALGQSHLRSITLLSLASPVPAWPVNSGPSCSATATTRSP